MGPSIFLPRGRIPHSTCKFSPSRDLWMMGLACVASAGIINVQSCRTCYRRGSVAGTICDRVLTHGVSLPRSLARQLILTHQRTAIVAAIGRCATAHLFNAMCSIAGNASLQMEQYKRTAVVDIDVAEFLQEQRGPSASPPTAAVAHNGLRQVGGELDARRDQLLSKLGRRGRPLQQTTHILDAAIGDVERATPGSERPRGGSEGHSRCAG